MLHEHELVARGLACWYKGRLIPVMRGGDGRDEPLFQLPDNLNDLSSFEDDELSTLATQLRERVREVLAGRTDPEVVGDRTRTQVADEMQAAVLAIEKIDGELAARAKDSKDYEDRMAALASQAGVESTPDGDGDDDSGDGDDGEGDGDDSGDGDSTASVSDDDTGETPAATPPAASTPAAASTAAPTRHRPLPAARRHRPVATTDDGRGLRVTSHVAGLGSPFEGNHVLNRGDLGVLLADLVRRNRIQHGQKAVVAHASFTYPRERMLEDGPDSHLINSQRIRDAINPETTSVEAMVASGGLCAPLPAIYDLPGIETSARPVRAALPSFQAARGGVQVPVNPGMGTYEDAVGVVTDAENTAGGTNAVKSCMRIECPDFNPVTVDSIYQCIEADNLAARAYPELMSRIGDLVNAEQARLADSKLLSAIKTGSTNVTGGGVEAGAVYEFLGDVFKAVAGLRSRHRTTEGATMQALIPAWLIDLLALDTVRQASQDNRSATRAAIEAQLRSAGIIPAFYLDSPSTGTGQIFGAQSAGALLEFPDEVQWAVFPAGSWLHLDSGELQLGVVRDSTLNSTNDFQIFAETWENVAYTGLESLWVTSEVCPSGVSAGGIDLSGLCGT